MRKIIIYFFLLLIFINFLYTFSGALHFPLQSFDVYNIWLLKAKAYFIENGFPFNTLKDPRYYHSHPQYPLLLPYLFYIFYRVIGQVNEIYVSLIYPFIYVATLLLAFKVFRKMGVSVLLSVIFTYIYSMLSPLLAQAGRFHAGNADIVITLIFWLAVYSLFKLRKDPTKLALIIVILTALASQIKLEGVVIAGLLLFLPLSKSQKVILFIISLIPFFSWMFIRERLGLPQDFLLMIQSINILILRTVDIIRYVITEMFNVKNWYIFWLLFWLSIYVGIGKNKIVKKQITPFLLFSMIIFFGNYLFTNIDPKYYVSGSVDRIMLQFSPFYYPIFIERTIYIVKKIRIIH